MKLKILKDCIYNNELLHKEGEVKEVDNANGMAMRWVTRGMAMVVSENYPGPEISFPEEASHSNVEVLAEQVEDLVTQVEQLVEEVQELAEESKVEIAKKAPKGKNKVSSKS